jgi:hypothetical protein
MIAISVRRGFAPHIRRSTCHVFPPQFLKSILATVESMLMIGFYRQACVNPILFATGVIPNVRIAARRQFTGGVLCQVSRRTGAIDYDLGYFVWQMRKFAAWKVSPMDFNFQSSKKA